MSLSANSNTINALGIFGRLIPEQEKYFHDLESKYSQFPSGDEAKDVFRHLTLIINRNVVSGEIPKYLDTLRKLKKFLPLKIKISDPIVVEESHIALSFDVSSTQVVRKIIENFFSNGTVITSYTKVVLSVSKDKQAEVIAILKSVSEMVFSDFVLVANRQDDDHTIYSSNRFSE